MNDPNETFPPEPEARHLSEAFARLVMDKKVFAAFFDSNEVRLDAPYVFYAILGGLPLRDRSAADDAAILLWEAHLEVVLAKYRRWLDSTGRLNAEAQRLVDEEIATRKAEAEDAAADAREG